MHLDMVYKTFVALMAAIVIIGSGLGVITGFSQVVAAENYMTSVSKVITESNFNPGVIERCKADAIENSYALDVQVIDATKAGVKKIAELKLTYYFEIKLFNIRQEKVQWKVL